MKILLNFNHNNNDYLFFTENETFYLGKYKKNTFEKIEESEKNSLKAIINLLISNDNIKDEFKKNNIIIKNNTTDITDELNNTIKINIENQKADNLKLNCSILNDKTIEIIRKQSDYTGIEDENSKFKNSLGNYVLSSIIIPIIILVIGWIIIMNTISTGGIFGGFNVVGPLLLLLLGCNIFSIIYEIVYIIKIIKKFIKQYSKSKTLILFLLIQILLFIILKYFQMFILRFTIQYNDNMLDIISCLFLFKIPLTIFISSLIIIYDLRKNDKTDNPKKTSLRIKIIISLLAILTIPLIIYRIVTINKYYEQQKPQQQETTKKIDNSYCTTYITETDKYIYCETNMGQIKQININTAEEIIYGDGVNDIPIYDANPINNKNYIYYLDYNANKLDNLYVIDIIKGAQTKIESYDIDLMDIYKSAEEKLYYTITDYPDYTKTTYMYDPSTNKNTKLNDGIDMIKYTNSNKIYHSQYNKMYIYDNANYTDNLLYENYNENIYDKELNTYILDKNNGMQYFINEGKFTIANITNNTIYFEDNSKEYTSFTINNNKLYIAYSNDYDNSIISIDLNDNNYNITEMNVEFYPTNNFIVHNNYLYYANFVNNNQLYKINLLDYKSEQIYNDAIHNIQKGNNDYIYFLTTNNKFIRLDTNTDKYEIIDEQMITE